MQSSMNIIIFLSQSFTIDMQCIVWINIYHKCQEYVHYYKPGMWHYNGVYCLFIFLQITTSFTMIIDFRVGTSSSCIQTFMSNPQELLISVITTSILYTDTIHYDCFIVSEGSFGDKGDISNDIFIKIM